MNLHTINSLINNSTWLDNEKQVVFQFSNGKDLSINGKNHIEYHLNSIGKKTVIQLGPRGKYTVEFINDFTLYLQNDNEKLKLMPE